MLAVSSFKKSVEKNVHYVSGSFLKKNRDNEFCLKYWLSPHEKASGILHLKVSNWGRLEKYSALTFLRILQSHNVHAVLWGSLRLPLVAQNIMVATRSPALMSGVNLGVLHDARRLISSSHSEERGP